MGEALRRWFMRVFSRENDNEPLPADPWEIREQEADKGDLYYRGYRDGYNAAVEHMRRRDNPMGGEAPGEKRS